MTRLSMMTLRRFIRPLIGSLVIVAAFALLFVYSRTAVVTTSAQENQTTPSTESTTATFNADAGSLGAIPDGTALSPLPAYGAPRDVTFTVTGLSGAVQTVEVSFTSGGPSHTFRGDVDCVLKAPGGTPSFTIFSRTGATSSGAFGSGSDLTGPYVFTDTATGANWWSVTATPTTPGSYRTTAPGPTTSPAPVTNLSAAFASVANPNGTWTLTFRDGASADTGAVSAASLTITTGVSLQHVVDFNGDGKTDFTVVRNTGGGAGGQITWFTLLNGGAVSGTAWGISTDFFVPEDYDGDSKTDVAVWRPGIATQAGFYILQSATNTFRFEAFGQTGDDPTVVGDYDGDNKADVAVYRAGANSGDPSTWYYRGSLSNPGGNVTYVPWGQNGDFPAPGDYNGDGKNDFVMQRNTGGGQARFWMLLSTGAIDNSIVFGTPTDVIVPGDYDGDGKTDVATVRGIAGAVTWFIRPSGGGSAYQATFGASATDFPTQGDYDGDGKTDLAIWRPSATAGQTVFWYFASGTSTANSIQWGQNGDYPVANYNAH